MQGYQSFSPYNLAAVSVKPVPPWYKTNRGVRPKQQVTKRIARIIKKPWVFRKYIGASMYWQIEGMAGFYSKVNTNRIPPGSVLAYDPDISQLHHFMPVGLFEIETAFERAVEQAAATYKPSPYVMPNWQSMMKNWNSASPQVNHGFFSGSYGAVSSGGK